MVLQANHTHRGLRAFVPKKIASRWLEDGRAGLLAKALQSNLWLGQSASWHSFEQYQQLSHLRQILPDSR
jgi:hypothetical protein